MVSAGSDMHARDHGFSYASIYCYLRNIYLLYYECVTFNDAHTVGLKRCFAAVPRGGVSPESLYGSPGGTPAPIPFRPRNSAIPAMPFPPTDRKRPGHFAPVRRSIRRYGYYTSFYALTFREFQRQEL